MTQKYNNNKDEITGVNPNEFLPVEDGKKDYVPSNDKPYVFAKDKPWEKPAGENLKNIKEANEKAREKEI